jgi:hypothetical protein
VRYFERRRPRYPRVETGDAIHHLNPDERRLLRRIQHRAVLRAALIGTLSATIVRLVDTFVLDPGWGDVAYWGSLAAVGATLAVFEITFLYWDALRSVHDLSHAAGLVLAGEGKEERREIARALARAALELPNPPHPAHGVDPRREVKKLRLAAVAVLYKAKISLTNFVLRALLRRVMGRAVARGLLSLVAIPVSATWNALVAYRVLREARVRVLGPSAIEEMCATVLDAAGTLSPLGRDTAVRAVGSAIVRTRDMHPNLYLLLVHVAAALREGADHHIDDPAVFLEQLERLPAHEQLTALRILTVASIIDGRVAGGEGALVEEALRRTGHIPTRRYVDKLRHAFVNGDAIPAERVLEVTE